MAVFLTMFCLQEHHLQRAMCTGLIIPTPEVNITPDKVAFDRLYPPNYKVSRQLIHMQRKFSTVEYQNLKRQLTERS